MTFFTSTTTPLYSLRWTPHSTADYAGTCIFLVVLATLFRALFAVKTTLERHWLDVALNRRYVVIAGRPTESQRVVGEEGRMKGGVSLLSAQGVEERVHVVRREHRVVMPWRVTVDLPRAGIVTVIAGIGYLL
jgi:copper transporter 1